MLVISFSISWIYQESSWFYFPQMPRKMTKFVLNDLFEDIKIFLERASSSDQLKSSLVGCVFLLEVLHSSRWGATLCQPKIQQFPFLYHFLKKLKMPQLFFTFCWHPAKKIKMISQRTKISPKLFPYSSIVHNCAQINLYNCIAFGKKRFRCYILALNPLFSPG